MQRIDVSDLPEPLARAIDVMVKALRTIVAGTHQPHRDGRGPTLPTWRGTVKGPLTRAEIYDDAA